MRNAVSRFVRVTVDDSVIDEIDAYCKYFVNCCSMMLGQVTPTVWKYGVGLGINTMRGREAKHVKIQQFAVHATHATRWSHVLKHDYISNVWLRRQDNSSCKYTKTKSKEYLPANYGL